VFDLVHVCHLVGAHMADHPAVVEQIFFLLRQPENAGF
jgi:hypothetical protein